MAPSIREVDPNDLRLPPSRASGADPWKLHQQIRQFGSSKDGMPPILVHEHPDGILEVSDGVTRATRIAGCHWWVLPPVSGVFVHWWQEPPVPPAARGARPRHELP